MCSDCRTRSPSDRLIAVDVGNRLVFLARLAVQPLIGLGALGPEHVGQRLAKQRILVAAGARRRDGVGETIDVAFVGDEDGVGLAVGDDAQEVALLLEALGHVLETLCRGRRASRRAVAPKGEQRGEHESDREQENDQQPLQARFVDAERLLTVDLVHQDPGRALDRPAGHQHLVARIVAIDAEIAGLVDGERRGEPGRVARLLLLERRRAVAQRRQILDDRAGFAHQHGFGGLFGGARLLEQREQRVVDRLQPKDDSDLVIGRRIFLHRIDRVDETDGRSAARRDVEVDKSRLAARQVAQERLQRALDRREIRRRDHRAEIEVEQRQAGDADASHVGGHVGPDRRGAEPGALGGHDQEIGQEADLGRIRGVRLLLAQLDAGQIKPERIVVGQIGEHALAFRHPAFDRGGPAVGHDAEPGLPIEHLALALLVDEAEDEHHGKAGDCQDDNNRGDHLEHGRTAAPSACRAGVPARGLVSHRARPRASGGMGIKRRQDIPNIRVNINHKDLSTDQIGKKLIKL